ncbi:MAG: class I SAM-dependent methyltransferase [Leptolyngbyaceae cyanobacterium MO_188.B28]|nr:class I SAM-dependent methyltransferase [Leptolyngbyaceae cyanobacterium MO_188.B28]
MSRFEAFEKNVDRYEAWFEHHRPAYESELEAIRALLPKNGEGLEVGVGTGRFAAPLGICKGIDPSPAMAKLASERGIEVRFGVGENLPYEDSQFDFVLLVTTTCFLDDVPAALGEAYRVLRPGGYILIGLVDRESSLGKVYEERKQNNVFYRDATFLSTDEVVTYLKQTGFCDFVFLQTIFQNLEDIKEVKPVKPCYGEGSFVVVRGTKPSVPTRYPRTA